MSNERMTDAALADALHNIDEVLQYINPQGEVRSVLLQAAAALRARPQAVAEDTARLDFVIRDEALVESWSNVGGAKTVYRLAWENGENQREWYQSPREAIDARMLAASQSATGGA